MVKEWWARRAQWCGVGGPKGPRGRGAAGPKSPTRWERCARKAPWWESVVGAVGVAVPKAPMVWRCWARRSYGVGMMSPKGPAGWEWCPNGPVGWEWTRSAHGARDGSGMPEGPSNVGPGGGPERTCGAGLVGPKGPMGWERWARKAPL